MFLLKQIKLTNHNCYKFNRLVPFNIMFKNQFLLTQTDWFQVTFSIAVFMYINEQKVQYMNIELATIYRSTDIKVPSKFYLLIISQLPKVDE